MIMFTLSFCFIYKSTKNEENDKVKVLKMTILLLWFCIAVEARKIVSKYDSDNENHLNKP